MDMMSFVLSAAIDPFMPPVQPYPTIDDGTREGMRSHVEAVYCASAGVVGVEIVLCGFRAGARTEGFVAKDTDACKGSPMFWIERSSNERFPGCFSGSLESLHLSRLQVVLLYEGNDGLAG